MHRDFILFSSPQIGSPGPPFPANASSPATKSKDYPLDPLSLVAVSWVLGTSWKKIYRVMPALRQWAPSRRVVRPKHT